ncbi:hypothetical protein GGU10DRAFT_337429 [Lentinula aff. detonsa]|uniref:Uncharacterized protein n=1 Tax=Lentinula aff. detonsa TaxID=2804958 RepID=A0AA38L1N2_9AGAR|nr:hypothetical protein GGU10DRAFT_337429 [Lentinula aff. detonsa]
MGLQSQSQMDLDKPDESDKSSSSLKEDGEFSDPESKSMEPMDPDKADVTQQRVIMLYVCGSQSNVRNPMLLLPLTLDTQHVGGTTNSSVEAQLPFLLLLGLCFQGGDEMAEVAHEWSEGFRI